MCLWSLAVYANEQYVGVAIREEGLKRDDLYVTTKFAGLKGGIRPSIETSLKKASQICICFVNTLTEPSGKQQLGLKHVDLYLIHHPMFIKEGLESSWREFEKIKEDGLSRYAVLFFFSPETFAFAYGSNHRSIGVSNFGLDLLKQLVKIANVKPAVNQVRRSPLLFSIGRKRHWLLN